MSITMTGGTGIVDPQHAGDFLLGLMEQLKLRRFLEVGQPDEALHARIAREFPDATVHSVANDGSFLATHHGAAIYDLVYLDDEARRGELAADIRSWLPRVRPGGVLAGSGFNHRHIPVQRALASVFDLTAVGVGPDSIWFVILTEDLHVGPAAHG